MDQERDGFNIQGPVSSSDGTFIPSASSLASSGTPASIMAALASANIKMDAATMENVKSLIVAGGAGLSHKHLSKFLGPELAAAVGAALSAAVAKNLIKPKTQINRSNRRST